MGTKVRVKMRVTFLFQFIAVLILTFGSWSLFAKEFYDESYFFWRRPELQKKMQEKKEILVSVTKDSSGEMDVWSMKGAGIVRANCPAVHHWALDFSQLQKMKNHFPEVSWNPKKTELNLSVQVLGKIQKIRFQLSQEDLLSAQPNVRRIHFEVLEGAYKGALGVLILTDAAQQSCEVGLISVFKGKIINFGSSVFAIAVEGLLHYVAKSLRSGVENAKTE